MYFINVLKKFSAQFLNSKTKEVSKMKKIFVVCIAVLLAIGLNVLPAMAYTNIGNGSVTISASGTLAGNTVDFGAIVVDQNTGGNAGTPGSISFAAPSSSELTNSGRAIRITGGTNEVDARIVIYTDNATNTSGSNKVPTVNPGIGIDGAGMVGQSNAGYAVPLFWGAKALADLDPNSNITYAGFTKAGVANGTCLYLVDKRHTHSFTGVDAQYAANPSPFNTAAGMDSNAMYTVSGVVVPNPASATGDPGLYPQSWSQDYYDKVDTDATRKVVSQALYKNIATVAFGIGPGGTTDPDNYVCRVGKVNSSGAVVGSNVKALLKKTGTTGTEQYIYIYIGADFGGVPAQVYSTGTLTVEMVKG